MFIKEAEESKSSVNESEAVHHHDCDEAYEPSAISELAYSERELDGHTLACSLKETLNLYTINTARRMYCSRAHA